MRIEKNDNNLKKLAQIFSEITSQDVLEAELLSKISVMISAERIRRNLTQNQFAHLLGVSQTMVSKWESSDYNFTIKQLAKVFDKLSMPIDIVYRKDQEKTNSYCNACTKKISGMWTNSNSRSFYSTYREV